MLKPAHEVNYTRLVKFIMSTVEICGPTSPTKIKLFSFSNVLVLNLLVPRGQIAVRNEAKCSLSKIYLFSIFILKALCIFVHVEHVAVSNTSLARWSL